MTDARHLANEDGIPTIEQLFIGQVERQFLSQVSEECRVRDLSALVRHLVGGTERLLRFRQAADATVGLTQLKVGGVTVRRELPCGFEAFDCASLFTFIAVRVPAAEIP